MKKYVNDMTIFLNKPLDLALRENLKKYKFTEKQTMICLMLMDGWSNLEIANHYDLEVATVKNHMIRIYGRTGLENRAIFISHFLKLLFADLQKSAESSKKTPCKDTLTILPQ